MILGRRSPFTWLLVLLTVIFFFVISRSDKSSSGNVAYKPRRAASTNQRAYRTSSPQAREQQPPTANSNEHGADAYDWLEQRERAARVVDAAVEEGRRKAQANVRVGAPAFPERGRGKPEREGWRDNEPAQLGRYRQDSHQLYNEQLQEQRVAAGHVPSYDDEEVDEDVDETRRRVNEDVDGQLDAAQNRGKRVKGGKHLGAIAVGAAAGKEREVPAKLNAAEQPDQKKWAAGWAGRFKQKQQAPVTQDTPVKDAILSHALVARMLDLNFLDSGAPEGVPLAERDDDEDEEQERFATRIRTSNSPKRTRFNMTLCALVPQEQRFLPEWLAYHRLLGVERFVLYDTAAQGAAGAAEVDALADKIEAEGRGELSPKAEELKAAFGTFVGGLDERNRIYPERIQGVEPWLEQGLVTYHFMKFHDTRKARDFHAQMASHCAERYSSSTNFLMHLDVDEFLVAPESLYSSEEPYREDEADPQSRWHFPLHDVLLRPSIAESACVPVPELQYRNVGVRLLLPGQSVTSSHTKRNVVHSGHVADKVLIHPMFTSDFVTFDGPHSCRVMDSPPPGVTNEIRDSQGTLISAGGAYHSTSLPLEPLAVAHYQQRDLSDCHRKMGALDDPNSLHETGRGQIVCDEYYLPSTEEMASPRFREDPQNKFLSRTPSEGSIVDDLRVKSSWAARAARALVEQWALLEPATPSRVEAAQAKVQILEI